MRIRNAIKASRNHTLGEYAHSCECGICGQINTSGGSSPADGAEVSGIQNTVNPGTNDGTGVGGVTYAGKSAGSNNVPY